MPDAPFRHAQAHLAQVEAKKGGAYSALRDAEQAGPCPLKSTCALQAVEKVLSTACASFQRFIKVLKTAD